MILGDTIALRPVEEKDLPQLAAWRNDPRTIVYLDTQLQIPTAGQKNYYHDLVNDPTRMQFMIVRLLDGVEVGTIGLTRIDYRNQSCRPAPFQVAPSERHALLGVDALKTLFRYAFDELNLHRLYGSVLDFNTKMLLRLKALGFKEEGIARKAYFVQGEYHDAIYVALLREEWPEDRPNRGLGARRHTPAGSPHIHPAASNPALAVQVERPSLPS